MISDVSTDGNWLFNLMHVDAVSIIARLQRPYNNFLYTPCTVMLIHHDLNEYFFVCHPANIYTAFENFHLWNFNFWDSPSVSNSHLSNSHVKFVSYFQVYGINDYHDIILCIVVVACLF